MAKGAKLLLGGKVPDRPGAWYPATVLTDVRPGQPAHDEEVFGPVAAIIAADDEADAIRIANASEFGLGSGVLTADLDRGRRIAAEELEAGMSFVNENVRSDPRTPFGGVKHSGYGRECGVLRHPRVRQHQDGACEADGPRRRQFGRVASRSPAPGTIWSGCTWSRGGPSCPGGASPDWAARRAADCSRRAACRSRAGPSCRSS